MTTHTLFVCRSCSATIAHDDVADDTLTEGVLLLRRLQELSWTDLNVQSVGCLWTCNQPCSVTFACPGKYTYHFVDLDHENSIIELQQFSELYINNPVGYVKPPKMPEELRSHLLVRVPPVLNAQSSE